jgi:hypothetical protein
MSVDAKTMFWAVIGVLGGLTAGFSDYHEAFMWVGAIVINGSIFSLAYLLIWKDGEK